MNNFNRLIRDLLLLIWEEHFCINPMDMENSCHPPSMFDSNAPVMMEFPMQEPKQSLRTRWPSGFWGALSYFADHIIFRLDRPIDRSWDILD